MGEGGGDPSWVRGVQTVWARERRDPSGVRGPDGAHDKGEGEKRVRCAERERKASKRGLRGQARGRRWEVRVRTRESGGVRGGETTREGGQQQGYRAATGSDRQRTDGKQSARRQRGQRADNAQTADHSVDRQWRNSKGDAVKQREPGTREAGPRSEVAREHEGMFRLDLRLRQRHLKLER
ncbi:hypothetical protein BJY52DRAFT_1232085 [Lactarius psammicola]|nr:hypothetical protein BJY52DRAFT_1232085 [Lactarius psammicola]